MGLPQQCMWSLLQHLYTLCLWYLWLRWHFLVHLQNSITVIFHLFDLQTSPPFGRTYLISCFRIDFCMTSSLLFYFFSVIVQDRKFCCIWIRFVIRSQQLTQFHIFNFLGFCWTFCCEVKKEYHFLLFISSTHSRGPFLLICFEYCGPSFIWL